LVAVFQELLRGGLTEPQTPIVAIPLVDHTVEPHGSQYWLSAHPTTEYPRDLSVTAIFHEQVKSHPDRIAITDSTSKSTYAEVDRQSNMLAWWLRRHHHVGQDTAVVGVLAPRCRQTIVAFLGILKANMAYLPLDANTPPGRLASILSEV